MALQVFMQIEYIHVQPDVHTPNLRISSVKASCQQVSFYSFVPDRILLASVQQMPKQIPQEWCLNIKYIEVQDANKRRRLYFLIPEQVSEIPACVRGKNGKIDDVLKIYTNI
jgi:hypothetical protein